MPFENFYKTEDEANRPWWKCVGMAFLFFIGYWAFAFLTMPEFEGDKKAAEYLSGYELSQRFKELCTKPPKPEQFYSTNNSLPKTNDASALVVYTYYSDQRFEGVIPSVLVWFSSNGWEKVPKRQEEL